MLGYVTPSYVDIKLKQKEKKQEKEILFKQKLYKRFNLGIFCRICRNRFGFENLIDNDKYVEITKTYNEYLTLKKLNLK